jgi:hypothetical protein
MYIKKYSMLLALLFFIPAQTYDSHIRYDDQTDYEETSTIRAKNKKPYTIIIYMAADNDLRGFAARNIKQMASIGSNQYINIVVHLDIRIANNKKITRRYYIDYNQILHVNANDQASQQMDSGQPETLISACKWAITDYPADNYILFFWNHGTGILDPQQGRIISATELFSYNPATQLLELDRTTSILGADNQITRFQDSNNLIWLLERDQSPIECAAIDDNLQTDDPRGICWDDSTGNYLTNQKLDHALHVIRHTYMNGKKFAIIGFDACLMAMIEVGNLITKHTDIMVSSQEVELGTGWNYQKVLEPFASRNLSTVEFAKHIVHIYEETYNKITNDYTQSAIYTGTLKSLENALQDLSKILLEALRLQKNKSVHNALSASKNKLLCTHFDEPSYIDLHHFLSNLEQNIKHLSFTDTTRGQEITESIRKLITQAKAALNKTVFANVCGKNLAQARGLSIYFPESRIHSSYANTPFAQQNAWFKLIQTYVAG